MEHNMNISSYLVIAAGVIGTLGLLAFTLPQKVHVEREAIIQAEPEEIFVLASSNKGFQAFNPYKSIDPDLKIEFFGPEVGVGSGFHFDGKDGKDGKGTQTISSLEANQSVTMQIDLGAKGAPTQTFNFHKVPAGTRVVWGLDADFGNNPIGRIIGLFMDKMMGETFERGLKNLSVAVASK